MCTTNPLVSSSPQSKIQTEFFIQSFGFAKTKKKTFFTCVCWLQSWWYKSFEPSEKRSRRPPVSSDMMLSDDEEAEKSAGRIYEGGCKDCKLADGANGRRSTQRFVHKRLSGETTWLQNCRCNKKQWLYERNLLYLETFMILKIHNMWILLKLFLGNKKLNQ